jgi:hypothetical protein
MSGYLERSLACLFAGLCKQPSEDNDRRCAVTHEVCQCEGRTGDCLYRSGEVLREYDDEPDGSISWAVWVTSEQGVQVEDHRIVSTTVDFRRMFDCGAIDVGEGNERLGFKGYLDKLERARNLQELPKWIGSWANRVSNDTGS